jgi:hypothetical protein
VCGFDVVMGLFAHADTVYMIGARNASIISTFFLKNAKFFPAGEYTKVSFNLRIPYATVGEGLDPP